MSMAEIWLVVGFSVAAFLLVVGVAAWHFDPESRPKTLPNYEKKKALWEPHIDELMVRVRHIADEHLRAGMLRPSDAVLDVLQMHRMYKQYERMTLEKLLSWERNMLLEFKHLNNCSVRCAMSLELAVLYAVIAERGGRQTLAFDFYLEHVEKPKPQHVTEDP